MTISLRTAAKGRRRAESKSFGELNDRALVALVRGGEAAAFEALYERHHRPLFRTALAMTRRKHVAEDVLQEAFLRAYRHIGRVRLEDGASLRPWLHRILINLIYDRSARKRLPSGPLETVVGRLASRAQSPERRFERREMAGVVDEAIAALPDNHRAVVVLFYVHDMDVAEIALTLGVPEGTVKSRLFYARARLREALGADRRLERQVAVGEVVRHALS
jgi:RNA polymerase sigma-70 factor (ECF subfamily)